MLQKALKDAALEKKKKKFFQQKEKEQTLATSAITAV